MTLLAILIGTIGAGVGSVWLAALLGFSVLARFTQHMLSLAAGALMATAFMHLLPEAFESEAGAHELFSLLLAVLQQQQKVLDVRGVFFSARVQVFVIALKS